MYTIKRIDDPDFGCEGIQEGQIPMAEVYLTDENGKESSVKVSDASLYHNNISEGDTVELVNGELIKK